MDKLTQIAQMQFETLTSTEQMLSSLLNCNLSPAAQIIAETIKEKVSTAIENVNRSFE